MRCCVSVQRGRAGFTAAESDDWSPALKLDGMGMMDLPNGQSSIFNTAATASEVRPHLRPDHLIPFAQHLL